MYEDLHEHPIAGVDEVGRGAIAGPVVACAVIMPKHSLIEGVYDSKKLSKGKRALFAKKIAEIAVCFSYGVVDAKKIDEINILRATLYAMEIAIDGLSPKPKTVLVDGIHSPSTLFPVVCVKSGDTCSFSIAAASILAKVYRDGLMEKLHEVHPDYGFLSHKGYGTKRHFEAVEKFGVSHMHRKSFIKNPI